MQKMKFSLSKTNDPLVMNRKKKKKEKKKKKMHFSKILQVFWLLLLISN